MHLSRNRSLGSFPFIEKIPVSAPDSDQSKSFSAFGPTAFQDRTASGGRHSGAKTAFVRSFDFRRLISSFHFQFPFSGTASGICFSLLFIQWMNRQYTSAIAKFKPKVKINREKLTEIRHFGQEKVTAGFPFFAFFLFHDIYFFRKSVILYP